MSSVNFLTFKNWMKNQFDRSELLELATYGAQNGFMGLIYYHETSALYDQYHDEIWSILEQDREEEGIQTCLDIIASFNGGKNVASDEQYKNLLVWYAAEKIAFELTEDKYLNESEKTIVQI